MEKIINTYLWLLMVKYIFHLSSLFTAGQWSCGKVMFLCVHLSVSQSAHRVGVPKWPLSMHWTSLYSPPPTSDLPQPQPGHQTPHSGPAPKLSPAASDIQWASLVTCLSLFTRGPSTPLVLTFAGHQSMYSRKACSTHPTGMHSCYFLFSDYQ